MAAPAPSAIGLEAAVSAVAVAPEAGGAEVQAGLDRLFQGNPAEGAVVDGMPDPVLPPEYLPVPVTVQETDYSCGAAAVLALLRYWQVYGGDEASLYPLLGTRPKDGTLPENIEAGLRHFGLQADLRERMTLSDLRSALESGKTVILAMQAWREEASRSWADEWESGHYVVLNGMDQDYVYLMDPSTEERYAFVPIAEFLERRYYQAGIVASGNAGLARPAEPPSLPGRMDLRKPLGPWSKH
ncbi:MAG: C39 family peptidase [Elusimicrobiota bacterium]|jgi:predicted double-glycine peptidase